MRILWIITLVSYAAQALLSFNHISNLVGCLLLAGFADFSAIGIIIEISKKVKYGARYGSRLKIIHSSLLVFLMLASIALLVYKANFDTADLKPFKSTEGQYASINPVQQKVIAPIKGKAVIVDQDAKAIDADLFRSLPGEFAAKNPDEVTVVVLVKRGVIKVGEYSNGGGAYIQTCAVKVVDLATHVLIAEKTIQGGAPAEKISSGEGYGESPDDDVIQYITEILSNGP